MEFEKPRVIGLCGDIGAGKDTVALHLAQQHGYFQLGWAYKLKQVCLDVYGPLGAERRHFFGTQADKAEPIPGITDCRGFACTGRSIMEHLGTEGFRAVDPATWVKYTSVCMHRNPDRHYVIPDVRFQNEFDAIRMRHGVVWSVVCVGGPLETQRRTGHQSDEEWRSIPPDDIVVAKYGDLVGLKQGVDLIFQQGRLSMELYKDARGAE